MKQYVTPTPNNSTTDDQTSIQVITRSITIVVIWHPEIETYKIYGIQFTLDLQMCAKILNTFQRYLK